MSFPSPQEGPLSLKGTSCQEKSSDKKEMAYLHHWNLAGLALHWHWHCHLELLEKVSITCIQRVGVCLQLKAPGSWTSPLRSKGVTRGSHCESGGVASLRTTGRLLSPVVSWPDAGCDDRWSTAAWKTVLVNHIACERYSKSDLSLREFAAASSRRRQHFPGRLSHLIRQTLTNEMEMEKDWNENDSPNCNVVWTLRFLSLG
jgi:hypothetical protein